MKGFPLEPGYACHNKSSRTDPQEIKIDMEV